MTRRVTRTQLIAGMAQAMYAPGRILALDDGAGHHRVCATADCRRWARPGGTVCSACNQRAHRARSQERAQLEPAIARQQRPQQLRRILEDAQLAGWRAAIDNRNRPAEWKPTRTEAA